MKQSRLTDSQIIVIVKQVGAGVSVPEVCSEHGVSSATFYKQLSKYTGMNVSLMTKMCELEAENARLKKVVLKSGSELRSFRRSWQKRGEAIFVQKDDEDGV